MNLWGGLECTLNRVENSFFSQCDKSGHTLRKGDLEKFATLNIKKIRYPCLWESVYQENGTYHWNWLDDRLEELRRLDIQPIAGLLHHGSGPQYTNLLDPCFPEKFALYAQKFAERYPWVNDYIPIDEILTTARFSTLYGHWYPHTRDDSSFVKALFNQVKASILAIKTIRLINPQAQFIQAEDMGRAQSTEILSYQRDFENHRRWLPFDMLCGLFNNENPLFKFLQEAGFTDSKVAWLQENSLKPDLLGINHYLLSNRYLDHRLELYPPYCHGRNYFHTYADIGSVDTSEAQFIPPEDIFLEVWDRYKIPMAITEVHVRGHREAQMRWLYQVWNAACKLKSQGVEIHAVTAWSLLGSYDWNSLCVRSENFYEPGIFDLRTSDKQPKKTALSQLVSNLASGESASHPVLESKGWWENRSQLLYSLSHSLPRKAGVVKYPILILGGAGTLGQAFARICDQRDLPYRLLKRCDLDIADESSVQKVLNEIRPWAVINTAGYVKIDQAEQERTLCYRENVQGATNLAAWCADHHIPLLQYSSDYVFNGENPEPYLESDPPSPINIYGCSKAEGETKVLEIHSQALVIRTSCFFGPWDQVNFATKTLKKIYQNISVETASDLHCSPTYIPDLVNASLDLVIDKEYGIVHLVNSSKVSWTDFAHSLLKLSRPESLNENLIIGKTAAEMKFSARRPNNSALASERFRVLPDLDNAIGRYFYELEVPLK